MSKNVIIQNKRLRILAVAGCWVGLFAVCYLITSLLVGSFVSLELKRARYREDVEVQGSPEERAKACAKPGKLTYPIPYSQKLDVTFYTNQEKCYRKEPDLAKNTNTISIQAIKGESIVPVVRIINQFDNNTENNNWARLEKDVKTEYGMNAQKITSSQIPIMSTEAASRLEQDKILKILNYEPADNNTVYFFADSANIYYMVFYGFDKFEPGDIEITSSK